MAAGTGPNVDSGVLGRLTGPSAEVEEEARKVAAGEVSEESKGLPRRRGAGQQAAPEPSVESAEPTAPSGEEEGVSAPSSAVSEIAAANLAGMSAAQPSSSHATRPAEQQSAASDIAGSVLGMDYVRNNAVASMKGFPQQWRDSGYSPKNQLPTEFYPDAEPEGSAGSGLSQVTTYETKSTKKGQKTTSRTIDADLYVEEFQQLEETKDLPEQDRKRATETIRDTIAKNMDLRRRRREGREGLMSQGIADRTRDKSLPTRLWKRFSSSAKRMRGTVKSDLKGARYDASSIYQTLVVDQSILPHQVSLGIEDLVDCLRAPGSRIVGLVNAKLEELGEPLLSKDACLEDINILARAINQIEFEVVLDKTPVNKRSSTQVRTLKIRSGRGIGLHPTQLKGYNADFDGDPAFMHFGTEKETEKYNRAMAFLVDIDGKPLIDPDFFPLDLIDESNKDEVKRSMEQKFGIINRKGLGDIKLAVDLVFDSYYTLCNAPNDQNWVKFLKDLQKAAKTLARSDFNSNDENKLLSTLLYNIYEFSADRRASVISSRIDGDWIGIGNWNPPSRDLAPMVEPMIDLVEEMVADGVAGRPSISVLELTKLFNKYYGDIVNPNKKDELERKNVPFRLLADFAKAVNRTDLITVGDKDHGIPPRDPNDKSDISINDLMKYLSATATTLRIKGAVALGNQEFATYSWVKSEVFRNIGGIPDWAPFYDVAEFRDWIDRFIHEYNYQITILNSANSAVDMGAGLHKGKIRPTINPVTKEGLRDAFVDVFGTRTLGYIFGFGGEASFLDYGDTKGAKGLEGGASRKEIDGVIVKGPSMKDSGYKMLEEYYKNWTIDEFVANNMISFANEGSISKMTAIRNRYRDNTFMPMDLVLDIADLRSVNYQNYHSSWEDATEAAYDVISDIRRFCADDSFSGIFTVGDFINEWIELVHSVSPEMFDYFGMSSPGEFLTSKWGKALLSCVPQDKTLKKRGSKDGIEAKSFFLPKFRSVWVAMYVEYRTDGLSRMLHQLYYEQDDGVFDTETRARWNYELEASFECELKALGSSSPVWKAITSDISNGNELFNKIIFQYRGENASIGAEEISLGSESNLAKWINREFKKELKDLTTSEEYKSRVKKEKKTLLDSEMKNRAVSNLQARYSGIVGFLLDTDASYNIKMEMLAYLTRRSVKNTNIGENEIMGQLVCSPDSFHGGKKFDTDNKIFSDIATVKASIDKISSYRKKGPKAIKKAGDEVVAAAEADVAGFERLLVEMSTEPGGMMYVDPLIFTDAVVSVFDKTYRDSEKGEQQPRVNGAFEVLSNQHSGGFFTHLQQTDNAVIGKVGWDQLTARDIVTILANPNLRITVYDMFGREAEFSRESLCGGNTIEDVISYLKMNPKIALACRKLVGGVSNRNTNGGLKKSDSSYASGTAVAYASNNNDLGSSVQDRIFSIFNDRPKFLALGMLCTPSNGMSGRVMSSRVKTTIYDGIIPMLINWIDYDSATGECSFNPENIPLMIQYDMGLGEKCERVKELKRERLLIPGTGGTTGFPAEFYFDGDDAEVDEMVKAFYSQLEGCLTEYATLLATHHVDLVARAKSEFSGSLIKNDQITRRLSVDEASVIGYFEARQQLSGARTQKMIDIEGAETKKNLALKEYLAQSSDFYTDIAKEDVTPELKQMLMEQLGRDIDQEFADDPSMFSIVIPIPDNWEAVDLTLEDDPNKQMRSCCKFLEIKRENGAEMFNMKAKKYGDDGKDSIIKYMKLAPRALLNKLGRKDWWSIEDSNALVDRIKNDYNNAINEAETIEDKAAKQVAVRKAMQDAIATLANGLLEADIRMGYIGDGDVFYRSDYYNRARLMIAQNSDGTIVIRSMEQLSAACRNRLSDEAIESGSKKVIFDELEEIVRVVGTDADPMAVRNQSVLHDCLMEVHAPMTNGEYTATSRALNPYASSNERNLGLLKALWEEFSKESYVEKRFSNGEIFAKRKLSNLPSELSKEIFGEYDYIGTPSDSQFFSNFRPGLDTLVYINDENDEKNQKAIELSIKYGATVVFSNSDLIPQEYINDVIFSDNGKYVLPCFDMLLNGSNDSAPGAPGMIPFDSDMVIKNVEDTTYEFRSGDASYHVTRELIDRMRVHFSGVAHFGYRDLFPNVLDAYPKSDFQMSVCSRDEIEKYLAYSEFNSDTMTLEDWDSVIVDIGVWEGDKASFAREKKRFELRFNEWKNNYFGSDASGCLTQNCKYDSIIGWVKIEIDGETKAVAPIWPFQYDQTGKRPTRFDVVTRNDGTSPIDYDPETSSFSIRWSYSDGILGHYIKFFEGIGASNKLITKAEPVRSRTLANGMPIDGFYHTKTVAGRFFASNKRMNTFTTLMMITRMDPNYAYNFAENSNSFPDNPIVDVDGQQMPLKEAVLNCTLTISQWQQIVEANPDIKWHDDPDINSLVKMWVNRCIEFGTVNPNILLATRTPAGMGKPMYTEFECFYDSNIEFQNAFMHFFNLMNPTLVPPSLSPNENQKNTLFKPCVDRSSENYGCLQMLVPHYVDLGGALFGEITEENLVPENVYFSFGFFGDEFSGFKRMNVDGYNRASDVLNVAAYRTDEDVVELMKVARSNMGSVAKPSGKSLMESGDGVYVSDDQIVTDEGFTTLANILSETAQAAINSWNKVPETTTEDVAEPEPELEPEPESALDADTTESKIKVLIGESSRGLTREQSQIAANGYKAIMERNAGSTIRIRESVSPNLRSFILGEAPDTQGFTVPSDARNDGITHINIGPAAKTDLGQFLDPWREQYVSVWVGDNKLMFASTEAYVWWLHISDKCPVDKRDHLRTLSGTAAREEGLKLAREYPSGIRDDKMEEMVEAYIKARLDTKPVREALKNMYADEARRRLLYLPIRNYYIIGNGDDKGCTESFDGKFWYVSDYTKQVLDEIVSQVASEAGSTSSAS